MLSNNERNEVKLKALELGFTEEQARKISMNAEHVLPYTTDKQDFLLDTFEWGTSPEGLDYWLQEYTNSDVPITQSEKQQLLSILRESLKDSTWYRDSHKRAAGLYWSSAEKGTPSGEASFRLFSEMNKDAKKYKKEVNKISNLIRKVKAI